MSFPKLETKHIKLLHVDDEPDFLAITKFYLEKLEKQIIIENLIDPNEVIPRIQENSYDIIVSDYQMPDMNGLELLSSVREIDPKMPFIIFTGRGREEIAIDALNMGANYYIKKGEDLESQFRELLHVITRTVQHKQMEEALLQSQEQYRKLLDQFPFAIEVFLPSGDLEYVNSAFEKLWHVKGTELIGKYNVFNNPKIEELGVMPMMKKHFRGEVSEITLPETEFDPQQFGLPGRKRWIQTKGYLITAENDQVLKVVTITQDITNQKKMEQNIQELKKSLSSIENKSQ